MRDMDFFPVFITYLYCTYRKELTAHICENQSIIISRAHHLTEMKCFILKFKLNCLPKLNNAINNKYGMKKGHTSEHRPGGSLPVDRINIFNTHS